MNLTYAGSTAPSGAGKGNLPLAVITSVTPLPTRATAAIRPPANAPENIAWLTPPWLPVLVQRRPFHFGARNEQGAFIRNYNGDWSPLLAIWVANRVMTWLTECRLGNDNYLKVNIALFSRGVKLSLLAKRPPSNACATSGCRAALFLSVGLLLSDGGLE